MHGIRIASLFLASILVLSFTSTSFAESEDDIEIEIEVEVEDGIAKIEAEFDGQELEFDLEETDRDVIIHEIIERTGLTREQIEDVIKFEVEEEDAHEEERDEETRPDSDKIAICHIPPGNPSKAHTITVGGPAVDTHLAHGDVIGSCDGQEFSATLGESKFAEKQAEREAKLAEKQMEIDARLSEKQMENEARLAEQEAQALQRAEELIQKLEQRIADLEQRLQSLLQA